MSQAGRVKNAATPHEIAQVIRGALRSGPNAELLCNPDLSKVVEHFQEVLVDVLKVKPRPTVTVLKQAALEGWGVEPGLAQLFAARMAAAANQASSGKKLTLPAQRVISVTNKGIKTRGRQMLRRHSSEAEPPSKRQALSSLSGAHDTSVTAEAPAPKVPQKAASSSVADVYKLYGLEPTAVASEAVVLSSQEI